MAIDVRDVGGRFGTIRPVARQFRLSHQVCRFHTRRWVGARLRELERTLGPAWQETIADIRQLVDELPAEGDRWLFALWKAIGARAPGSGKQASALCKLRQLVLRLSEGWEVYRLFVEREDAPSTNNGTERAIGKLNVRSRSVRGWKSAQGLEAMAHLSMGAIVG